MSNVYNIYDIFISNNHTSIPENMIKNLVILHAFCQLTIVFAAGPWPGVPIIDLREPTEAELGAHMPREWQTCDMELDLTCPNYNMNRDGTPEQIYSQLRRIARLRWLRCTYGNQVMRQDSSFTEYMTKLT